MNAHGRRVVAVNNLVTQYLNEHTSFELRDDVFPSDIAKAIRPLTELGITRRWYNAVRTWERMVLDTENDLKWALLQGSILALHNS